MSQDAGERMDSTPKRISYICTSAAFQHDLQVYGFELDMLKMQLVTETIMNSHAGGSDRRKNRIRGLISIGIWSTCRWFGLKNVLSTPYLVCV